MYIVKKKISGREYFYLNEAVRENGKVKSKNIAYLGKDQAEAEEKANKIIDDLLSINYISHSECSIFDKLLRKLKMSRRKFVRHGLIKYYKELKAKLEDERRNNERNINKSED